jgi:hypothetical protein
MRAISRKGDPTVSVSRAKKNTLSQTIGYLIGIQSSLTLEFGASLNGELKDMILVKAEHSAAFITSTSQTLTA